MPSAWSLYHHAGPSWILPRTPSSGGVAITVTPVADQDKDGFADGYDVAYVAAEAPAYAPKGTA